MVGAQRLNKVDQYGPLDGGELAIPYDIDCDVAFKQWAFVVLERKWLLLNES